jgi:hypothetical protein
MIAMNSNTFRTLRGNKSIMNRFITTAGVNVSTVSDGDIVQVLKDSLELDGVVIYNKKYRDESKVTKQFVPDGYVALLPDGGLGNTYLGTTPEEADLRSAGIADVQIVDTGVALTQIVDAHPVNVNTFASEIVLPSYERMDEVALLKVF